MHTWRRLLQLVVVIVALSALTIGCGTMQGLGRDIQKAGDSLERAAD